MNFRKKPLITAMSILLLTGFLQACGGGGGGGGDSLSGNDGGTDTGGGGGGDGGGDGGGGTTPPTSLSVNFDALPSSVAYGETTEIGVTAAGVTGSAVFALVAAPAGMSIDSATGDITWTPAGVMFGDSRSVTFTVRVTDSAGSATRSATVLVSGDALPPLVRSSAKVPTSENAIKVGDFDGDGRVELLTTDNKGLLYTMEYDEGGLSQDWVYAYSFGDGSHIAAIDVAEMDGDDHPDFVVLTSNIVAVIDGATRQLTYSAAINSTRGFAVAARDIDNDSRIDIVVLSGTETSQKLSVYNLPISGATLALKWQSAAGNYGTSMAIGSLDTADANLEIALSKGYVFDAVTHADQWDTDNGRYDFGTLLTVADIDARPPAEIIGLDTTEGGFIRIINAELSSAQFAYNARHGFVMCSLASGNMDVDAEDEVLVGFCGEDTGSEVGSVAEYVGVLTAGTETSFTANLRDEYYLDHLLTGVEAEERQISGYRSLTVGDVNGDGTPDVMWANGIAEDHYDAIVIADGDSLERSDAEESAGQALLANSAALALLEGDYRGAFEMTLPGDTSAVVFSSYINPSEPIEGLETSFDYAEHLVFMDASSGTTERMADAIGVGAERPLSALFASDVVGAGYDLLVASVSTDPILFGQVQDEELSWVEFIDVSDRNNPQFAFGPGRLGAQVNGPLAIGALDTDGVADDLSDDELDLIVNLGSQVVSYDLVEGVQLWNSDNRNIGVLVDLKVANGDSDVENELYTLSTTTLQGMDRSHEAVLNGITYYDDAFSVARSVAGTMFTAFETADLNGDDVAEVIVADKTAANQSVVAVYSGSLVKQGQVTLNGVVTDITVDHSGSRPEVLVAWRSAEASDSKIALTYISSYGVSGSTVAELWRSPGLLGEVQANAMNFSKDGSRLIIGTEYGMYITR